MRLGTILLPSKQVEIVQKLKLSRAELEQHRRQRTNVSEELALEREKRANKHDAVREGMGTAAGGLGLLNGVLGTVSHIKAVF